MLLDVTTLANRMTPAVVNISGSGDTIIVAAALGKVITLVKLALLFGGTTNFTFKDGTTALSGPMPFSSGMSMVFDLDTWYSTSPGNALVFNSSQAVSIAGTAWTVTALGTS